MLLSLSGYTEHIKLQYSHIPQSLVQPERPVARSKVDLTENAVNIPNLSELVLSFESLGDNCEFGMFQRQVGAEPLGLLRFSSSFSPESLLRALDHRFEGLANLDNLELKVGTNDEFMVRIRSYDFIYHSGRKQNEIEPDTLRLEQQVKLRFLVKRLSKTLENGEKIVVRKGGGAHTLDEAQTLLKALRSFGPVTLLWVVEADDEHPAGSVTLIAPNLLCARMSHFAPYARAANTDYTCWVDICRNSYQLWKSRPANGTTLAPDWRDNQGANILTDPAVRFEAATETRNVMRKQNMLLQFVCGASLWRMPNSHVICQNVKTSEEPGLVWCVLEGLTPGAIYTFSAWVRSGPSSPVNAARVHFKGRHSTRSRRFRTRLKGKWQRIEVTAEAPASGVMYPELQVLGSSGAALFMANWRVEEGFIIDAFEPPGQFASS